jgi:molybdate transport system substrate-binding protein
MGNIMKKMIRLAAAGITATILSTQAGVANAAEVKMLSAVAVKSALDELIAGAERATGHKVAVAYATAGVLRDRIKAGEAFDITILPRPFMDPLVAQGTIAPASATVFARSLVSVGVRAGAPKPDISTAEAFKRTMLTAKSISYADPAKGGGSGIHAASVIERLGIAEEMKPKTKLVPGAESVDLVANGEAEIAIVNTPVIVGKPGVELVGPLPAELQNTTDFVFFVGVGANAKEPDAAKALIKYLQAPEAARIIKGKGMEPGQG